MLCNHTVLSMGFDAPKTDMVLIARQVFSFTPTITAGGISMMGERDASWSVKNQSSAAARLVPGVDDPSFPPSSNAQKFNLPATFS